MSRRPFPRRWPMLKLADGLASIMPAPKNKNGILLLRMFGIGDALLFRAVLEKYAEALGASLSEIVILGSTSWASLKPYFGDIKIILINERRFTRDFFYRLRVMLNIRKRGFKTALCGQRLRYPHVIEALMAASAANDRIVAEARPNKKFDAMFAHYAPLMTRVIVQPENEKPRAEDGSPLPLMHEITQQLAFLSAVAGRTIELQSLPKLLQTVTGSAPPMNERYAVLAIGASYAPRRWPLNSFLEVANRLAEQGWSVVVLGGPAEIDLIPALRNFEKAKNERIILSVNELNFAQAAQLIGHAGMVISNDSGLGHLAIMLDRPSVIILGGGHFGAFMPYPAALTPPHVKVLYHSMPCYHCNWNCTVMPPGGTVFPCVSNVSADQVLAALEEIKPAA